MYGRARCRGRMAVDNLTWRRWSKSAAFFAISRWRGEERFARGAEGGKSACKLGVFGRHARCCVRQISAICAAAGAVQVGGGLVVGGGTGGARARLYLHPHAARLVARACTLACSCRAGEGTPFACAWISGRACGWG